MAQYKIVTCSVVHVARLHMSQKRCHSCTLGQVKIHIHCIYYISLSHFPLPRVCIHISLNTYMYLNWWSLFVTKLCLANYKMELTQSCASEEMVLNQLCCQPHQRIHLISKQIICRAGTSVSWQPYAKLAGDWLGRLLPMGGDRIIDLELVIQDWLDWLVTMVGGKVIDWLIDPFFKIGWTDL